MKLKNDCWHCEIGALIDERITDDGLGPDIVSALAQLIGEFIIHAPNKQRAELIRETFTLITESAGGRVIESRIEKNEDKSALH